MADEPDVEPGYSGNAHIKVLFIVNSDEFHPQFITDKLGINPDVAWAKGEQRHPHPRPAKFNRWELAGEPNGSLEIGGHVEALLKRIEVFEDRLKQLPSEMYLKIDIAVYLSSDHSPPGLYLEPSLMARMARLGLNFEVSTYTYMMMGDGPSE